MYRRLGGPQGRSGRMRKISPPPGFDPRNVQSVASRYTNYAIPATDGLSKTTKNIDFLSLISSGSKWAFPEPKIEVVMFEPSRVLLPVEFVWSNHGADVFLEKGSKHSDGYRRTVLNIFYR